jgi:uncharacterized protein involved in exopolysaccharide biosynthesis
VTEVNAREDSIDRLTEPSGRIRIALRDRELASVSLSARDYGRILKRDGLKVVLIGLLGGVLGYFASYLIPPAYKASATLIPMSSKDRFGSLGALGIDLQSLGIGTDGSDLSPAMYPEIAESRAVLSEVLSDAYYVTPGSQRIRYIEWVRPNGEGRIRYESAMRSAREAVSTSIDRRSGTMTISVRDRDPGVAAQVANSVAEGLQHFVVTALATQAGQKRKFIESRLPEIRQDLSAAEGALASFREQNLRIGNSPRLALEEARLSRAVREQEEIYLTVSREYELTKIQENRDVPLLAMLDSAVPPIRKFWPPRSLFALLGLALTAGSLIFRSVYREPPGTLT